MADISKIIFGDNTYDIKDAAVRDKIKIIDTVYSSAKENSNTYRCELTNAFWYAENKVEFDSRETIKSGDKFIKLGILASSSSFLDDVTHLDTDLVLSSTKVQFEKVSSSSAYDVVFPFKKTNVAEGDIWYIRPYSVYINSRGYTCVKYGAISKVTATKPNPTIEILTPEKASAIYIDNTLSDRIQGLIIHGRSETVDDSIVSIGDSGSLVVKTEGGDGTESATITSGLPLRGIPVSDGGNIIINGKKWLTDTLDSVAGTITKRCYVDDGEVKPLEEIVTVSLTNAEKAAINSLKTHDGHTVLYVDDEPYCEVSIIRDTSYMIPDIMAKTDDLYNENEVTTAINNGTYDGVDLTVKFADEIANYTDKWAWIKARISDGNFTGIHVADYIPFTMTVSGTAYKFKARIAGINSYLNFCENATNTSRITENHIDFISDELFPVNHRYNAVDTNNGTAASSQPVSWLASDLYYWLNSLSGNIASTTTPSSTSATAVDYTSGGVYYYLPTVLKNVISSKLMMLPRRYSSSGTLTSDNSESWAYCGNLWLPSEGEIYGTGIYGGNTAYTLQSEVPAYPLFLTSRRFFAKRIATTSIDTGDYDHYWTRTASGTDSTSFVIMTTAGKPATNTATTERKVPICFRVMGD